MFDGDAVADSVDWKTSAVGLAYPQTVMVLGPRLEWNEAPVVMRPVESLEVHRRDLSRAVTVFKP